jgi:hypothetical protein
MGLRLKVFIKRRHMDLKTAFDILDVDLTEVNYNDITPDYLKKKYHKAALQYHPDKNGNTSESNMKFQLIHSAYEYLKEEFDGKEEKETKETSDPKYPVYIDILKMFMTSAKYSVSFSSIVTEIIVGCKQVSIKLFADLDRETSLKIYSFLSKYRLLFHLDQSVIDRVREIVISKCSDIVVYNLNPSLSDLLETKIYKLYDEQHLLLVPLWHNELYFDYVSDNVTKEVVVLCEPQLQPEMTIDENNNLHIIVNFAFEHIRESIISNSNLQFKIDQTVFEIPTERLYLKREQMYRIKNQGLTRIKDDIYDVSERADIIVKLMIS